MSTLFSLKGKLVVMLALFCSVLSYGQSNENIISIGISEGLGGTHLFLSPTLDLLIYNSKLKFSSIPIYPRYLAIGLTQEIKPLKNKNLKWIASINFCQSKYHYWGPISDWGLIFRNYSITSGIMKTYKNGIQTNFQFGAVGIDLIYPGPVDEPVRSFHLLPYGDLSLSFKIFQFNKKDKKQALHLSNM
jgi:hypothetical protein